MVALVREHLVDGDPVQPRAEGAAALEGRETPPGTYESLLHTILRRVVSSRHAQAQAHDLAAMKAIQALESLHVALAGCSHQRAVRERRAIRSQCRTVGSGPGRQSRLSPLAFVDWMRSGSGRFKAKRGGLSRIQGGRGMDCRQDRQGPEI